MLQFSTINFQACAMNFLSSSFDTNLLGKKELDFRKNMLLSLPEGDFAHVFNKHSAVLTIACCLIAPAV